MNNTENEAFSITQVYEKSTSEKVNIIRYIYVFLLACLMAVNYEIFILPNAFAPAGINGIATMIQYKLGFSIGYMNLLINIPLCLVAFILLDRDYSVKTFLFCLAFSAVLIFLKGSEEIGKFAFSPENDANSTLAAIAAGVVNGFIYGSLMRVNASTGGTDIISAMVRCKKPHLSLARIIFTLNSCVAAVSFFVYDFKYEPVILCILYAFVTSRVSDSIVKGIREQIKFEIITDKPEEISREIILTLRHSATAIEAKGMYSEKEKYLLICIINKHQIFDLQKILKKYPDTFAYISSVSETVGNFKKIS